MAEPPLITLVVLDAVLPVFSMMSLFFSVDLLVTNRIDLAIVGEHGSSDWC